MIGPNAPTSPVDQFVQTLAEMRQRIAELERAAQRADGPRGQLGRESLTSAFSTSSTHTTYQAEGLNVAIDEPAGRLLRITLILNPYVLGGANSIAYKLRRASSDVREWHLPPGGLSSTTSFGMTLTHVVASSAGSSIDWNLQIKALLNNTEVNSYADSAKPRQILVEDIGPA